MSGQQLPSQAGTGNTSTSNNPMQVGTGQVIPPFTAPPMVLGPAPVQPPTSGPSGPGDKKATLNREGGSKWLARDR
ncbi:hypothetical protein LTR17_020230 [Elasticomyces elasticus]|nr:hypothetical protein LTR17_020230 [Elasticomyces elasticus]